MIVFDENIEQYWIDLIANKGYDFISIRTQYQGISDNEVINITKAAKGILITEDKDFGELLFSHKADKIAVLFLRYDQPQYSQIESYFLKCIDDYLANPKICFITINKNKIRIRTI